MNPKVLCPFCEKITSKIVASFLNVRCNYSMGLYNCENHHPLKVEFWYNYNNSQVEDVEISNEEYKIITNKEENIMEITKFNIPIAKIPLDKSLTLENFEKKLKTYLLFL